MIFVVFTILCALLLAAMVYSRIHWVLKILLIVGVFTFCFLVWSAQDTKAGYPTARPFPNDAQFVSCIVQEPDASHGITGSIYLWLIPLKNRGGGLFAYTPKVYEPRAYQEPYDEDLQKACQQASKLASGGQPVRLSKAKKHKGGGKPAASGNVNLQGKYRAYRLPPVLPPQKTR